MAGEVKTRMAESTALLLAKKGLQATSFSDVLELSGAPRGSLYHHFPGGKDELVETALGVAEARLQALLASWQGATAVEIAERFTGAWRAVLTRSELQAGCAVVAVTVAADSPVLLDRTAAIFRAWRAQLAGLLETGGLAAEDAATFAATLVASCEGAVVMARAEQSLEPFELVAGQLIRQAEALTAR